MIRRDVTDEGLAHLSELTNLSKLELNCAQVTDGGLAQSEESDQAFKSKPRQLCRSRQWFDAPPAAGQSLRSQVVSAKVTDAGLAHLSELKNLSTLVLWDCAVTDNGLVHLNGLSKLSELSLQGSKISGPGLDQLSGLASLTLLDLSISKVTDEGLAHLAALPKLSYLVLDNTNITDAGLVHLKRLTRLNYLSLTDTKVTKAGVAELKQALPGVDITEP